VRNICWLIASRYFFCGSFSAPRRIRQILESVTGCAGMFHPVFGASGKKPPKGAEMPQMRQHMDKSLSH
jgi:hypothetical protein